jgi:hypothetical protein
MNRRHRLQAAAAVAALPLALASVAGFAGLPAAAQPTNYSLTAAANEASVEVDAANFPLLAPQAVYLSPGTAQAALDSFGGSTAFASAPFLGQTVEGIGGLASGLGSGVLPPLPRTLPGYVATVSPSNPTEDQSQGPYTLTSNSTQDSSSAVAAIGVVSGQPQLLVTSATATTTRKDDGSLQATAQAVLEPLAIGSLLHLGTVQATATMTVDADGTLTKSSSLDLGSLTIAGIRIGLTENGLRVLDSLLPLPSTAELNGVLAGFGLQVNFLPASQTATSVTSAGLQIVEKQTLPIEGATALVITIGQATATLRYQTAPPSGGEGGAIAVDAVPPTPPAAGLLLPTSPDLAAAPRVDTSSPATPSPGTLVRADIRLGPDAIRWYGILALAALALTLASRLASAIAINPRRRTR